MFRCITILKWSEHCDGRWEKYLVKSFLVTTSIQETWPQDKKSIIFLGKWCFSYSGKEKLNNVDTKYTKYHWDDRNKLFNDYQYLSHLYEDLLISLSQKWRI